MFELGVNKGTMMSFERGRHYYYQSLSVGRVIVENVIHFCSSSYGTKN